MTNTKIGVSDDALKLLERVMSVKLPKPYRTWLAENNHGRPEKLGFAFFDVPRGTEDNSSIHDMYAINALGGGGDLYDLWKLFSDRLPKDILAIANDPLGNQICIAVKGPHYGQVFFFCHDENRDGDPWPGFSPLAKTFDAFLSSLTE